MRSDKFSKSNAFVVFVVEDGHNEGEGDVRETFGRRSRDVQETFGRHSGDIPTDQRNAQCETP